MRIVMPLFDLRCNEQGEYGFLGGRYKLVHFDPTTEIPDCILFSELDRKYMEQPAWALVAEDPISPRYAEDINLLLLAFQVCRRASVFVKYRLCKEDPEKYCSRISAPLWHRPPDEDPGPLAFSDLDAINERFQRLLEMQSVSNRTHNAIYFTYRGLSSDKMIDSFALLTMAIESLFSPETRGGVTKIVCSRASAFLGPSDPHSPADMHSLYDLRSRIVHGRVAVEDDIKGKIDILHDLQRILLGCLKKMLTEKTYNLYHDASEKEKYFKELVGIP